MNYRLSFPNALSHFIWIELSISDIDSEEILLAIPTWRPGRYEAANYSKNIRNLKISDERGEEITYTKLNHSSWKVSTNSVKSIFITYEYFAFKMDAGNSWFDDELIYVNFINCLIYDKDRQNEVCTVALDLPSFSSVSCGLPFEDNTFIAKDYFQLVDSPLIASEHLEHYQYPVFDKTFNIWINGKHSLDISKLLKEFQLFSEVQVAIMEGFPEDSYHFQVLVLPYKIYHGVEHHNSTVICLGPGEKLHEEELYSQLLGVSSHELFHAWNIIKIRPNELSPYQFDKEVSFPTGYVAEGFTTYYGDLFLVRCKVFDHDVYFNELNVILKRHFSNFGRLNHSLINSSIDLWVDGYTNATPHRKSSIYVEGAIVALSLDLMIRKRTDDKKSLDDVMRSLDQEYGKSKIGYSHPDIIRVCETVYGDDLVGFFKDHVEGTKPKEALLNSLLNHVGCELIDVVPENPIERWFGVRIINQNGLNIISLIAPNSIGEKHFSIDDEIISINDLAPTYENLLRIEKQHCIFKIKRNYTSIEIRLDPGPNSYFNQYAVRKMLNRTTQQEESLSKWIN